MKQNNWFDPFFILENISAEEKLIQKNVRDFSNNVSNKKLGFIL